MKFVNTTAELKSALGKDGDVQIENEVGDFKEATTLRWQCPKCEEGTYLIPTSTEKYSTGVCAAAYCQKCNTMFRFEANVKVIKTIGRAHD